MKFEFQLNKSERLLLDRLNKVQTLTPSKLVGVTLACVVPSIFILVLIDSWATLFLLLAMIGFVVTMTVRQMISKNRATELTRRIELSRTGKLEAVGGSQMMVKWDLIDEIQESNETFIFDRLGRHSLLPKRVIESEKLDEVRDFLLNVRNKPENPHLPLSMYEDLFNNQEGSATYCYQFEEDDVIASVGPMLVKLQENKFTVKDVLHRVRSPRPWLGRIAFFLIMSFLLGILATVISDERFRAIMMMTAVTLPFLLVLVYSMINRRRAKKNLPLVPRDEYQFRLLAEGWATGEPNAVSFHRWNAKTCFYLSKHFIGIKSDNSLINLIPNRAFSPQETVDQQALDDQARARHLFDFLQSAIRICRKRINQIDREKNGGLPVAETVETGNPYQAPASHNS